MNHLRIGRTFKDMLERMAGDRKEYVKVLLLFGYLFCVTAASTTGRTTADALFLSRFDNSFLSFMYLPQALTMIVTGILYQRYFHKVRLETFILALIPLISLLVLLSRIGVGLELRWVFPVIYIGYDVFNFLMIVCFWQFATSVMDQRKAKRTIGIVGSGGIAGAILSGFGLKAFVPLIGTSNLIYLYAFLQLLALFIVIYLVRISRSTAAARPAAPPPSRAAAARQVQSKSGLFQNVPHLKYIAILTAVVVLSLTLIDYQFKVILRGTLQNEELAGFMGSFYGFSGLIALAVQLFAAGRILSRFGVMAALLVFPIILAAGSLGVLILPVLAMAAVVKGSDKVVGDTLYASVNQLVMFPIRPEWRAKAKGFVDGVVKNGAKGLAAVCLLVFTPLMNAEQFSYIVLVLLAVGIFAALKVKKAYLHTLMESLRTGGDDLEKAELNFMDPASLRILTDALTNPDKQQALYALRILRGTAAFDLSPYIEGLLQHADSEVRTEVLSDIEASTPPGLEEQVRGMLAVSDIQIRRKALLALAAYADERYLDEISEHLEDQEAEVQAAAIAALVKYYGIEGMFRAVGRLKQLLGSSNEEDRMAMASLFGQIGITSFYKPLLSLLHDPSHKVRRSALQSAAILRVPLLVPSIIQALQDRQTRKEAVETLAAYDGEQILTLLQPYLDDREASMYLFAVYEQIGTQPAAGILLSAYGRSDFDQRDRILASLQRMNKAMFQLYRAEVEGYILQETEQYSQFAEQGAALAGVNGCSQIVQIIDELRYRMCQRAFGLVTLLYEEKMFRTVFFNWSEGDVMRQANATEVVDQTLKGTLRTAMVKLMSAPRSVVRAGQEQEERIEAAIRWFLLQEDEWLSSNIAVYIQQRPDSCPMPGNNEYAVSAEDPEQLDEYLERVRLLRGVSLFQGLTSKELSVIARRLQKQMFRAGYPIIQEGEPGDSLMILDRGRAGVYRSDQQLSVLKREDCFGEMAVLTHGTRTATIRAEEDVTLWRLDSNDFYEMMIDQTSIAVEMMKLLSRRLRAALARGGNPDSLERPARELQEDASDITDISDEVILRRIFVLQKIELFSDLTLNEFIELARMVDEAQFEQGEVICQAGELGDTMYGIIEGHVRVHRGAEFIASLQEGESFGEMAIIDSGPRSADCTAATRTVLLQLHRDQVLSFCFQNTEVLKRLMRVLADRLKGMQ
ncbi:Npt1/Npt2 family nucleotide transporter [Paenibacillus mendelii]|uniref:ADP,ATP carrier protein n=1 Tax=Paenibacillus mendelii TaxID=206163 RepID=A0ABV6JKM3_9BACL|nr:Npt1/Npt2 family nucleotide transporter [Paenibacillus mendelii]MCQ6563020.1 cyclic nucleotide-binding domain-containing protein [Paenibacillus mendelii]